jgi:hypothetical protein
MAIVFIHSGYSPYLELSLRQARAADPDADVVLLGDAENDRFRFLRHVDVSGLDFADVAAPFERAYRHLSTNGYAFELACFRRWFMLRAFMEAEGLADALVLDSDVMLYATEAEVRAGLPAGAALGVCRPAEQGAYRWMASPHVSYWRADRAEAFCAFILQSYTDAGRLERYEQKWQYHLDQGLYGGICDMTALYLFGEEQQPGMVVNLAAERDACVHDANVNNAENLWPGEYRLRGGCKDVTFDALSRPWGFNVPLGRAVRFLTLHFQGKAKEFMAAHYRGARFPGDGAVARRLTRHYRARRFASTFVQPARLLAGKLGLR